MIDDKIIMASPTNLIFNKNHEYVTFREHPQIS